MKNQNPYQLFSNYVLRTPIFSFSVYKHLTRNEEIDVNELKKICSDKTFREAIFLASPNLLIQIDKWIDGEIIDKFKEQRLKNTILKYISRMCSRCTPFGLFAGCSVGSFSKNTSHILDKHSNYSRHTRLDMKFLCSLYYDLILNDNIILEKLLFSPNSSVFSSNNDIRYFQFKKQDDNRLHQQFSVEQNQFLNTVLKKAERGIHIKDLANELVENHHTSKKIAFRFIDLLINNQFLVSELEPNISGKYYFNVILEWLTKNLATHYVTSKLSEIDKKLKAIDAKLTNEIVNYKNVINLIDSLKIDYNIKHLFIVDLVPKMKSNTLSKELKKKIFDGFFIMNQLSNIPLEKNSLLEDFKIKFYDRYEEREISLAFALDPEIGIGYGNNINDMNPLIDDLNLVMKKRRPNKHTSVSSSLLNILIQKKLYEAYKNDQYVIEFSDKEINGIKVNYDDIPDTLSVTSKFINVKGKEKILISNEFALSSAANLFARFSFSDKNMTHHLRNIVAIEQNINDDKLIAEVVHLPITRVGNIISSLDLRKYEIQYLAKSIKKKHDSIININDLFISMNGYTKELSIKSKKLKKEIIPRLTNSYDFNRLESLPLYRFLCDIQLPQGKKKLTLNMMQYSNPLEFIPRIEYNNIIFHEATWNLSKNHFVSLLETSEEDLVNKMSLLRDKIKLPKFALYIRSESELVINFLNKDSVKMFLAEIKNKSTILLKEFLFEDDGYIKDSTEVNYYTNEFIFSFFNSKRLKNAD